MANQYRSVLASGGASTGGDAIAANVLAGKTFTNDNGPQTGTMPNNGAVSGSVTPSTPYTIPEGYHNGNGQVSFSGDLTITYGSEVSLSNGSNTLSPNTNYLLLPQGEDGSNGSVTVSGQTSNIRVTFNIYATPIITTPSNGAVTATFGTLSGIKAIPLVIS